MNFFKWGSVFIAIGISARYGWIYPLMILMLLVITLVSIDAYKEASSYKKAQYKADIIIAAQLKREIARQASAEHLYEGLRCRKRVRAN